MIAARIANMDEGRPKKTGSFDPVKPPMTRTVAADLLNVSEATVKLGHVTELAFPRYPLPGRSAACWGGEGRQGVLLPWPNLASPRSV